jgi:hypothetical protein
VLSLRRPVLVGVGITPRPIQRLLPGPGFIGCPLRGLLLLRCAVDLVDDQPIRLIIGERRHRQVGHVGIHPGPPASRDLGAAGPGGRGLMPALMYEEVGVVPPAARGFTVGDPYQVDLVPDAGIGQEMGQVRPLARPLG